MLSTDTAPSIFSYPKSTLGGYLGQNPRTIKLIIYYYNILHNNTNLFVIICAVCYFGVKNRELPDALAILDKEYNPLSEPTI